MLACKDADTSTSAAIAANSASAKIRFDLVKIGADGLVGPADGKRSLMYEFCIPAEDRYLKEVQAIDPSLQYSRSRGRIGCTQAQYLVIGDTHNPQWRERLMAITRLEYVKQINEFFGE